MRDVEMPKIVDREAMQDAILDAAVTTFAEKGFHAATMADLATAAGLGKGTLYLYFSGKDAVASAMVDRYFVQLADRLKAEGQPKTLEALLESLGKTMNVPSDEAGLIRVFFEVYGPSFSDEDFVQMMSRHFDELGAHYAAALEYLASLGEVREDLDVQSTGRTLASLVDGIVLHSALFGASEQRKMRLTTDAVSILSSGLKPQ